MEKLNLAQSLFTARTPHRIKKPKKLMGNCLRHESEIIWGGDNWGTADDWATPKSVKHDTRRSGWMGEETHDTDEEEEHEMLLRLEKIKKRKRRGARVASSPAVAAEKEVMKIQITKEEFQNLAGKDDLQQMLAQLINVADRYQQAQHRSWRPALKSIPE